VQATGAAVQYQTLGRCDYLNFRVDVAAPDYAVCWVWETHTKMVFVCVVPALMVEMLTASCGGVALMAMGTTSKVDC